MNRNDFEDLMFRYLDGELSSKEIKEFEDYLDKNPSCKEDLEKYEDLNQRMSNMNYLKASDSFMTGLNKKIYDLNNKRSWMEKFFDLELLGFNVRPVLGASLTVLIISSYFFYGLDLTNPSSNKMMIQLKEGKSNGDLALTDEDTSTVIQSPDVENKISKQNAKITSVKGNK